MYPPRRHPHPLSFPPFPGSGVLACVARRVLNFKFLLLEAVSQAIDKILKFDKHQFVA